MLRKLISLALLLTITISLTDAQNANANSLSSDTITIKIFGFPLNTIPGINVKLSFSNKDVANLSSTPPVFQGEGATQLLTEANSDTGIITAIWDGFVTNEQITLIAMLENGGFKGTSKVALEKIEIPGGFDITDSLAYVIEPDTILSSTGTLDTALGKFTLTQPENLTGPGKAAVAFLTQETPSDLKAILNNSPVDFTGGDIAVAIVELPAEGGKLPLTLKARSGNDEVLVNLGNFNVKKGVKLGLPPRIQRARAFSRDKKSVLKVRGRKFGKRRFGKDATKAEIVPNDKTRNIRKVTRLRFRTAADPANCIPEGSYINISNPAGTDARKIDVTGSCN